MPTPSADAAIKRWVAVVQGKSTEKLLRSSSVFAEGDSIYSFGTHFELARVLRDSKGKIRLILLNGDRVSQHTDSHQFLLRRAIQVAELPRVIIPFPALNEAGVNLESIVLLDEKPDRSVTTHHRTKVFPEGAHWHRGGYHRTPLTPDEVEVTLARWNSYRDGVEHPYITAEEFLTDDRWEYHRYHQKYVPDKMTLHMGLSSYGPEITVTREDDDSKTYTWKTTQHFLGESLIRARIEWLDDRGQRHHRWVTLLSGFDHQEPRPLYFLCELPYRARPQTVDEAYEVLKPDPVRMAEQINRSYTRQGDIFAVPTGLTRKELEARGARIVKSGAATPKATRIDPGGYILNTNHAGTEVAHLPGGLTLARGCLYHRPRGREADHVRRKLGDGKAWHIVVKNTVPTAGRR
jgi:hypothetical protein